MLTLQTVYPYGLNDRGADEYIGLLAISFYHYVIYTNAHIIITLKLNLIVLSWNFVKILTTHLDHNLKDASYFIRVSVKSFKKSFLKHVCNDVYDFLSSKADSFPNQQWYEMKTKTKNISKLHFANKGMNMIKFSKLINDKNLKKNLPTQFY